VIYVPFVFETEVVSAKRLENQPSLTVGLSGCSTGCSSPADSTTHLTSDLARLVEKWPSLPAHIKAAVMALVGTVPVPTSADPKLSDEQLPPGYEGRAGQGGG